ncbi:hypothetical protein JRQ81_013847 [Phrynocephalus forsythii]|uniref:Uncharacterized protein n=1 Tax=Phrynocephalus forsythii TaxID=171643 RepID=A0A9Q0Y1Y1_9SAUR|nr:hypothetical protein JRQ81_013847 [Phrynocephalus forsythii]
MFTMSGIKGETLGDIPLLVIGPAICLPGIAALTLAKKTNTCPKLPKHHCCPPCTCCCSSSRHEKLGDENILELLRTPRNWSLAKGAETSWPTKPGCFNLFCRDRNTQEMEEGGDLLNQG